MPQDDSPGEMLPTPFTADQIRSGCPTGRTLVVRTDIPGEEPQFLRVRYVESDATGTIHEHTPVDVDGRPLAEPQASRVSWETLRRHAEFPAASSECEPLVLDHPLGTLRCLRYTVREAGESDVFWFDPERPGMPILIESRTVDGEVSATRTVISDRAPRTP